MLLFWSFYGNGVHNIKFGEEAFADGWMDGPMNPSNPLINPLNPTNPMNPMNDSINPLYSDESEQNIEQEQGMEQGRSRTNSGNKNVKKKRVWIRLDILDIVIILSPFLLFAFVPFIINAYRSKQLKRIAEFEEKFSKSQLCCERSWCKRCCKHEKS